jgi:SAM-dependent methyltransferase
MRETSKTNSIRGKDFVARYLMGKIIDIGSADDPVCPSAERFDIPEGDANNIAAHRTAFSYDTVYSSHCLEHMVDIPAALTGWWSLVKPGGHMVIVVPHEDFYEQGFWPSIFNTDHKATFRLGGSSSWSPKSYDLRKIVEALPDATLISASVHDHGYNHALTRKGGTDRPLMRKRLFQLIRAINKIGALRPAIERQIYGIAFRLGCPVDQTLGNALAQIEVIVEKQKSAA